MSASLSQALHAAAGLASEGESPEYERGLCELIVDTFGADLSDLNPAIMTDGMETARPWVLAAIRAIQKPPLLEDRELGTYFLGNLNQGKALLRANLFNSQQIVTRVHEHGVVSVELHDGPLGKDQSTLQSWGSSASGDVEEAWRYLLGAEFGPIDAEYDEDRLRKVLSRWSA